MTQSSTENLGHSDRERRPVAPHCGGRRGPYPALPRIEGGGMELGVG